MDEQKIFSKTELELIRIAYARQISSLAGPGRKSSLERAFSKVARENFLGSPPWQMIRIPDVYNTISDPDPVLVYQDVLFALDSNQGINNGSPALHARWLFRADIKAGERVVHVGAGSGYYTAIIAELVGPSGEVLAIEFDDILAESARANLAHLDNVTVIAGDGMRSSIPMSDCIYVNFSVNRPMTNWIDNLSLGGRLIFPLGIPGRDLSGKKSRHAMYGAGLRVEHRTKDRFATEYLGPAFFVCASGNEQDLEGYDADWERLKNAFVSGGVEFVKSMIWKSKTAPNRAWYSDDMFALSYDEI